MPVQPPGDQNELTLRGASVGRTKAKRAFPGFPPKARGQGGTPGRLSPYPTPRQAYVWIGHGGPEREGACAPPDLAWQG